MKCDHCHGFGRTPVSMDPAPLGMAPYRLEPCPECNGCGTTSCCGDAVAQPEEKEDHDR
jgi:hypothetical protein